jgi:hypothetical protein
MNVFELPGDVDDTDATTPNAINGRRALLLAALQQPEFADLTELVATGPAQFVLIRVPSREWAVALTRHLQTESPAVHARTVTELKKDGNRGLAGELAEFLATGSHLVLVCADPDTLLPADLLAAVDITLNLGPPDAGLVRRAIEQLTDQPVPALEPADIAQLDFNALSAALRPGSTPESCIARLRRASQGSRAPRREDRGPRLDELPLSPEISAWSSSLLADLRRVEEGTLRPSDLIFPLLDGPPGTGKTLIAGALARSAGWRLVATSVGSWFTANDGYLGGVTRAVTEFFNELLREPNTIGFIDEIDAVPNRAHLAPKDREWWTPVVTLILLQIDRIRRSGKPVLLVGATNYWNRLDPALCRSGRIEQRVTVLPPGSVDEIARIFDHYLEGALDPAVVATAARCAQGWTPADVEAAVRAARSRAAAANRPMEDADLLESVVPPDPRTDAELRAIALHEAGHAVVSLSLGLPVETVSIIASGHSGGFTRGSAGTRVPTRGDLESLVMVMLGGRAADVQLGAGANAGAEQDLSTATALLLRAMGEFGLYGRLTHTAAPSLIRRPDERLEATLQQLLRQAMQLVQHHCAAVLALAEQLLQHRVLDGSAVERIFKAHRAAIEPGSGADGSLLNPQGPTS